MLFLRFTANKTYNITYDISLTAINTRVCILANIEVFNNHIVANKINFTTVGPGNILYIETSSILRTQGNQFHSVTRLNSKGFDQC